MGLLLMLRNVANAYSQWKVSIKDLLKKYFGQEEDRRKTYMVMVDEV
jgi:hypothetical protein